jgi:hypothetical protein
MHGTSKVLLDIQLSYERDWLGRTVEETSHVQVQVGKNSETTTNAMKQRSMILEKNRIISFGVHMQEED